MTATIDKTIGNVTEFLSYIFDEPQKDGTTRCFRGQRNIDWPIQPSVARKTSPNVESRMLSDLLIEVPRDFSNDTLMFEKLVRAQHYELPTRILDVSLNPLVALYFASAPPDSNEDSDTDGVVYLFDMSEERTKKPDSDALTLICNLAHLTTTEQESLTNDAKKCLDTLRNQKSEDKKNECLIEFRTSSACEKLYRLAKAEKNYFTNEINPSDLRKYYFVQPKKTDKRIIAQSGAFIVAGLLNYEKIGNTPAFGKSKAVSVPASRKAEIRRQLDKLNINKRSLFPDIVSAAADIKNRYQ